MKIQNHFLILCFLIFFVVLGSVHAANETTTTSSTSTTTSLLLTTTSSTVSTTTSTTASSTTSSTTTSSTESTTTSTTSSSTTTSSTTSSTESTTTSTTASSTTTSSTTSSTESTTTSTTASSTTTSTTTSSTVSTITSTTSSSTTSSTTTSSTVSTTTSSTSSSTTSSTTTTQQSNFAITSFTKTIDTSAYAVIIRITTNEPALCKADIAEKSFNDMTYTLESDTSRKNHEYVFSNLEEGHYYFYAKCKNDNDVYETDRLPVDIDYGPIATIFINDKIPDPSLPYKAGNYKITVKTNEAVKGIPQLKYTLDGQNYLNLPLQGKDNTFIGYMIIPEKEEENRAGSFQFYAQDYLGNVGTRIEQGGYFLIDTKRPPAVNDVRGKSKDEKAVISWNYYAHDDIVTFKIYRAEETGIEKLEVIGETKDKSFIDDTVEPEKTYYYAVTAVDRAGNEAPLTKEMSVFIEKKVLPKVKYTETEEYQEKKAAILSMISYYENYLETLQKKIAQFTPEEEKIIQELSLMPSIDMQGYRDQLENLETSNLDETTLKDELNTLERKIKARETEIIKDISIVKKGEEKNIPTPDDVDTLLYELIQGMRITPEEKEYQRYVKKQKRIQREIDVSTRYMLIKATTLDNKEQWITVIEKDIKENTESLKNPDDYLYVESIPKTLAESLSEIQFMNKYTAVKRDPIVSFSRSEMLKGIRYYIRKKIDPSTIQQIQTIIVKDPLKEFVKNQETIPLSEEDYLNISMNTTQKGNSLTGMIAGAFSFDGLSNQGLWLALGILLLLGLAYYYFFLLDNENHEKIIYEKKHHVDLYTPIVFGSTKKQKQQVPQLGYPNVIHHQQREAGIEPIKDIELKIWLKHAHHHINKGDFHTANKYYFMVTTHLSHLSEQEKAWIKKEYHRLYHKLRVWVKLHHAQKAYEKKDKYTLKELLNHIAESYNVLAEEVEEEELQFLAMIKERFHHYSLAVME